MLSLMQGTNSRPQKSFSLATRWATNRFRREYGGNYSEALVDIVDRCIAMLSADRIDPGTLLEDVAEGAHQNSLNKDLPRENKSETMLTNLVERCVKYDPAQRIRNCSGIGSLIRKHLSMDFLEDKTRSSSWPSLMRHTF